MEHHSDLRGKGLLFLLFLWFVWFINIGVRIIFAPILPLIEDEFMVSHAQASSIFLFQSLGYGLSIFFAGFYSGRFGYKRSIVLSLGISSLLFFCMPFIKVFWALHLFTFIMGISIGIYLPSAIPLITEYFAERHWGRTIAIHDSGAPISIFCTPFIALLLLHFFPWRGIFPVFGAIVLVNLIIFQLTTDEVRIKQSERAMFGGLIKSRPLWIMGILFTFGAGANLGVYSIVPLYLTKELSMSVGYANTILGVSRLGGIGVALVTGFVVDRINLRKALWLITLVTGIFTVLMGVVSVKYVGLILFLQAVVVTGFFPLGFVAIARMFGRETRSMATGLILTLSIVFGAGGIPYLLGLSGDLVSFKFGLLILGMLVCLSSMIALSLKELK